MMTRTSPVVLILSGIVATLAMDMGNVIGVAMLGLSKINLGLIGKLVASWSQGRFLFPSPAAIPPITHAQAAGLLLHYAMGILCAIGFGLYAARSGLHAPGMVLLGGAFGLLCSCINLLMIFPTIGLGCFGFNAGLQPLLGSLYNHLVFGLALGIWWAPGMARGAALAP